MLAVLEAGSIDGDGRGAVLTTETCLLHPNRGAGRTREELEATATGLFDVVLGGAVEIEVNQTYPLEEAATAHRDLEARKTTGSTVLRMAG